MAVFKAPDDWLRLDYKILQNGATSLYYQKKVLDEDLEWFRQHQYLICIFDCTEWTSLDVFHDDLAESLNFPDYYGRNLNALNDCLVDIEVPDQSGTLLVFLRFDHFAKKFRDTAQALLDIIETNSRRFLLTGQRLITLAQSDDPRLSFDPVGANIVQWNGREWLNKKRGL